MSGNQVSLRGSFKEGLPVRQWQQDLTLRIGGKSKSWWVSERMFEWRLILVLQWSACGDKFETRPHPWKQGGKSASLAVSGRLCQEETGLRASSRPSNDPGSWRSLKKSQVRLWTPSKSKTHQTPPRETLTSWDASETQFSRLGIFPERRGRLQVPGDSLQLFVFSLSTGLSHMWQGIELRILYNQWGD